MTKFLPFLLVFCLAHSVLIAQRAYTWNVAAGGVWTTAANWTPSRTTPNAGDTLIFNGGTKSITGVPTQSIGRLVISGNANITFVGAAANNTITITRAVSDAMIVQSGSTLQLRGLRSGGTEYSLTLTTANSAGLIANIYGTVVATTEAAARPGTFGAFSKGGANAQIRFHSGATYRHNVDGSSIPQSTWDATSTCLLTGITTTAPGNLNQNFAHFTYDCAGHASGVINFNTQLTSIAGNFTVRNAGTKSGTRALNGLSLASTVSGTINIGGDLIIDQPSTEATWLIMTTDNANLTMNIGGNFIMSNSGGSTGYCFFDYKFGTTSAMGTLVVNLVGNLNVSGGANLDMGYQAASYSVPAELRISGNLTADGGLAIVTSATNVANGKIIFNKSGLQTIQEVTLGSIRYVDYQVNGGSTLDVLSDLLLWEYPASAAYSIKSGDFVVSSNATLDLNTFTLFNYRATSGTPYNTPGSYSSFVLNSGAHLMTAKAEGVHHPLYVNRAVSATIATRTFSSAANYTYDGAVAQLSGVFVTTPTANTVNNLTINNTSGAASTGVKLQQHINVDATLSLNSGHVTTFQDSLLTLNATGVLVGGSDNSFVNGPMAKVGSTAFSFPVGKLNSGMRTIAFGTPSASSTFNAEFFPSNPQATYAFTPVINVLTALSACEYWIMNRTAGTGNAVVTLSWAPQSACNNTAYVLSPASLRVARHSGSNWVSEGNGGYSSSALPPFLSGTINSASAVTAFQNGSPRPTPFTLGTAALNNILSQNNIILTAERKASQTSIRFVNNSEVNVARYEILYSNDGVQYEKLQDVLPSRNNASEVTYDWTVKNNAGALHYYRIKIIEVGSKSAYSNTCRLMADLTHGIHILNNPVINKTIRLELAEMPLGNYTVQLINSNGQTVYQSMIAHRTQTAPYSLQLASAMADGVYNLILSGNGQRMSKPIIIK